jgi:superfamily II DNA or RNA helicase
VDYDAFLGAKHLRAVPLGMADPPFLSHQLFPFQSDIVRWALQRGRAAIFADCGLGKGWMALEWARCVAWKTEQPVLVVAPLAVAQQFQREGHRLRLTVNLCRDGADIRPGLNVTNYDRLHRFDGVQLGGVVLDESSILKDHTSATRNMILERFATTPFRLACTATPAPNDHMELGNHAEFLGTLSRQEMLATFFCHDGGETQAWRLKGHAERDFWRWVASWAVCVRKPSDLGYDDGDYALPPLRLHEHRVTTDNALAQASGLLFAVEAQTLDAQRAARRASLDDRVAIAAELVNGSKQPWILWCDLNSESEALTKAIPGAVEVRGSDDAEEKERRLADFSEGRTRVLVTKPSIAGHGMNWQHCAHVAFVGLSHSFEAYYQALRRTYRFGQKRPVNVHLITSTGEGAVLANLKRKQGEAETLHAELVAHLDDFTAVKAAGRELTTYRPHRDILIPDWLISEAV